MDAASGRQPGTDVEELADARLRQEPHGALEERAVGAGHRLGGRHRFEDLLAGLAVGGIVVLAVQEVVVDACRMGPAGVDLWRPTRVGAGLRSLRRTSGAAPRGASGRRVVLSAAAILRIGPVG